MADRGIDARALDSPCDAELAVPDPLPRNPAGKLLKNAPRGRGAVPFDASEIGLTGGVLTVTSVEPGLADRH